MLNGQAISLRARFSGSSSTAKSFGFFFARLIRLFSICRVARRSFSGRLIEKRFDFNRHVNLHLIDLSNSAALCCALCCERIHRWTRDFGVAHTTGPGMSQARDSARQKHNFQLRSTTIVELKQHYRPED
jgi:hypothetical protein